MVAPNVPRTPFTVFNAVSMAEMKDVAAEPPALIDEFTPSEEAVIDCEIVTETSSADKLE